MCGLRRAEISDRLCDENPNEKVEKYLKIAMEKEASLHVDSEYVNKIQSGVKYKNKSKVKS